MEKLFLIEIADNNNLKFGSVGETSTETKDVAMVPSWDLKDKSWSWLVRRTGDREIVLELYRDATIEYNSRPIILGKNGTGLVLSSGKHYVRAVDPSVVRYMHQHHIQCLDRHPEIESEFKNGATLQRRVFTLDKQPVKAVAGSFILDKESPYLVDTIRVKGSNKSVIHGICIPAGFRFDSPKKPVPMPAPKQEKKESVTEIHRSEIHTFAPEEPEKVENDDVITPTTSGTTIGEIAGAALDSLAIKVNE